MAISYDFDWADYDSAAELVTQRFNSAQAYAEAAQASAINHLAALAAIAAETPAVNTDFVITVQDINLNTTVQTLRPDRPDITMEDFLRPIRPEISDIVVDTLNNIPAFDIPNISIVYPATPTIDDIADPGDSPGIADPEFPVKPAYSLPAIPTLREANLPDPPSMALPEFDGAMPIDDLQIPSGNLNFSESGYTSDLLEDLKTKLHDDLAVGGTGLGAAVELAIWNREAERALLANLEAKTKLADEIAAAGWPLPDGVLVTAHLDIEKEYQNARLTSNRDIAVKQAELALENKKFTIMQAIALEQQLMTYASQMAQRSLEAAKAILDFSVAVFNAQVTKYNAKLEAYKTQAVVYETRIRAELAKIEIFKAQIEGQKLVLDINDAEVKIYTAQLAAVDAMVNIYKTEMQASAIKADTEKLKIDAFRARVEAYQARVQLHVARFNMYEAQIKGEAVKADVYGKQVDAFRARVEAAKVEADLVLARAKISMDIESYKMEIFKADIEAYKSQITAEATRIGALVDAYKGDVDMYKADGSIEEAIMTSQVKVFEARVNQAVAIAGLYLKQAEVNLSAFTSAQNLKGELAKAGAAVAAQLAASALAGTNASASLSDSSSNSSTQSQSNSASVQAITSNSDSNSTSTSTQYLYEM